jgi:hypothetical protein
MWHGYATLQLLCEGFALREAECDASDQ